MSDPSVAVLQQLTDELADLNTELIGQKNTLTQSASDASSSASFASQSSIDANQSAIEATQAKESASLITGLDTVEEAVDLVAPEMVAMGITQSSGGMNVYRLDANGNYNMMVKIPQFTNKIVNDTLGTNWLPEEDVHPAFLGADNNVKDWFEVGMYINSNDGSGNPISSAYSDPYTGLNYYEAKSKCSLQGTGWHMLSNAEWAAISIWCLMNNYQPTGNSYFGQSHDKKFQTAIRQDSGLIGDAVGAARTLTGSGGSQWNHNNMTVGVSDLVGNTLEWVDGLLLANGQIKTAVNSSSDDNDYVLQNAFLDAGNKLNSLKTADGTGSSIWGSLGKDASYVDNQLLQQLLIEPTSFTDSLLGKITYVNTSTRAPMRGGAWISSGEAGLACISFTSERSGSFTSAAFRSAYSE